MDEFEDGIVKKTSVIINEGMNKSSKKIIKVNFIFYKNINFYKVNIVKKYY